MKIKLIVSSILDLLRTLSNSNGSFSLPNPLTYSISTLFCSLFFSFSLWSSLFPYHDDYLSGFLGIVYHGYIHTTKQTHLR